MKKIRNLEYIPKECKNCNFIHKCRGGSRQIAKMSFGDYNKLDPLVIAKKYRGWALAPNQLIMPETPVENVIALYDTLNEYRWY